MKTVVPLTVPFFHDKLRILVEYRFLSSDKEGENRQRYSRLFSLVTCCASSLPAPSLQFVFSLFLSLFTFRSANLHFSHMARRKHPILTVTTSEQASRISLVIRRVYAWHDKLQTGHAKRCKKYSSYCTLRILFAIRKCICIVEHGLCHTGQSWKNISIIMIIEPARGHRTGYERIFLKIYWRYFSVQYIIKMLYKITIE